MDTAEFGAWMARDDVLSAYAPVKRLQGVLLQMLVVIDKVCQENDMCYYLFYGTQLGALRHKGFIPWDDDADIAMPRRDYDKFIKIAPTVLPDGYFLQSPYSEKYGRFSFAKLRKDGTTCTCRNHEHINMHQGIFVDIFPLDSVGGCSFLLRTIPRLFDRLAAFSCAILPRYIRFLYPLQWLWMKLFTPSCFGRLADISAKLLAGNGDSYVSVFCPVSRLRGGRSGWCKVLFGKPHRVSFEGVLLNVCEKAGDILSQCYGEWEALPSECARWPVHSEGGIIDPEHGYEHYHLTHE